MEHSKMSVKELKAFVKMYKKVHKTPFSKMKKPELVALAGRVSKGEVHKKEASDAPAAPKAPRAATEKQKAHRALFGAWVKAKTGKPFSEFKAGHHEAAPAAPKKEKKAKAEAPKAEAPKAAPKKKAKDLGATPSPAPKMKVEVIQKAADKELVTAMGGKAKAKKFVVEKELTEALSPKKFVFKKKEPKNE